MLVCQPRFSGDGSGADLLEFSSFEEVQDQLQLGSIYNMAQRALPEGEDLFGIRLFWKRHQPSVQVLSNGRELKFRVDGRFIEFRKNHPKLQQRV
jgi:hypothetical protein